MRTRGLALPAFITNTIQEDLPLHKCHPSLHFEAEPFMLPGTAFQMVMGPHRQKITCGVFLSPSEWYVDGHSRPLMVRTNRGLKLDFGLQQHPGSHIPSTQAQAIFMTMFVTRIEDEKTFSDMVRKMDSRIIIEIERRCLPRLIQTSTSQLPSQFVDVPSKYECSTCHRRFSSFRGRKRHSYRIEVAEWTPVWAEWTPACAEWTPAWAEWSPAWAEWTPAWAEWTPAWAEWGIFLTPNLSLSPVDRDNISARRVFVGFRVLEGANVMFVVTLKQTKTLSAASATNCTQVRPGSPTIVNDVTVQVLRLLLKVPPFSSSIVKV